MTVEIKQEPRLPGLSPNGRWRVDTFTVKACIDSLQKELSKVEAAALELGRPPSHPRRSLREVSAELFLRSQNGA